MKLLLPGTPVRVRPWSEIRATLDENGTLDGLPFMEEMRACCGRRFTVWRRAEKTCVESDGVRRLRKAVFLEGSRCSGTCHGGCERECTVFWNEAWLEAVGKNAPELPNSVGAVEPFPFPGLLPDGRYRCQSTELLNATSPLSKVNLAQYARDLTRRTWPVRAMLRFVVAALWLRLKVLFFGMSSVRLRGAQTRTPTESLGLQTGEWVRVKSRDEIVSTLNTQGRNRGLEFPQYMLPFIDKVYRVKKRVNRIIREDTGEMRAITNTVMLEGVTCDGYGRWGGCPREAFHLWREIWLRRVEK